MKVFHFFCTFKGGARGGGLGACFRSGGIGFFDFLTFWDDFDESRDALRAFEMRFTHSGCASRILDALRAFCIGCASRIRDAPVAFNMRSLRLATTGSLRFAPMELASLG